MTLSKAEFSVKRLGVARATALLIVPWTQEPLEIEG